MIALDPDKRYIVGRELGEDTKDELIHLGRELGEDTEDELIHLDSAGQHGMVSRQHANVSFSRGMTTENHAWCVTNLGSTN